MTPEKRSPAAKLPTARQRRGYRRSHHAHRRSRDWRIPFLAEFRETGNVRRACEIAGISRQTAYAHRQLEPEFAAQWEDALEDAVEKLELIARERAMTTSDTLLIFLLKAHRPTVYRERVDNTKWKIDVTQWTDAQLEAYQAGVPLAEVLAMQTIDVTPTATSITQTTALTPTGAADRS